MRISVIGHPGSGKTTLAAAISKKFAIPHIHLDRFWFESGGATGEYDTRNIGEVRSMVRERALRAIAADEWVSDGFFHRIQPFIAVRADTVVFLDIPLWKRLFAHTKRTLKPRTRHPEVSRWDDIKFFPEMVRRTYAKRRQYETLLAAFPAKTVVLRSWKQADRFLAELIASAAKPGMLEQTRKNPEGQAGVRSQERQLGERSALADAPVAHP